MKVSNIVLSTTILSVSLMALPNEGELILPDKGRISTEVKVIPQPTQNMSDLENKSSDDIIKLLDDVNKKRIEFEEMQKASRERDKRNDKDYVLEQLKKDNKILEEKLRTTSIAEREIQKALDLEAIQEDKKLQFQEEARNIIEVLKASLVNIKTEYRVDGTYTFKSIGDSQKIKINGKIMATVIERIMVNLKDIENIKKQIKYYSFIAKSQDINFLKNVEKYEEPYNKTDFLSLKGEYGELELIELQNNDEVYSNIIITNLSNTSYTLKYNK